MPRQMTSILDLTLSASADVEAYRFVSLAGAQTAANAARPAGVSMTSADSGDSFTASFIGTAVVEAASAIAKGDAVASAANGKAQKQTSSNPVLGYALEAAGADGDFIEILFA